jgi:hypothetical protein
MQIEKSSETKIISSDFKLRSVRISYPHLFEARAVGESEPKFSASFLIPKDDPQLQELRRNINLAIKHKWGALSPGAKQAIQTCLHDGEEKNIDSYEDVFFVNASSKKRPGAFDRDRSELTADDGYPYAGCFVNAIIRLWAQDNRFGKRINAELRGVQFVRDGEPLGNSKPVTAEDFEDLGAGDQGESDDDGPIPY